MDPALSRARRNGAFWLAGGVVGMVIFGLSWFWLQPFVSSGASSAIAITSCIFIVVCCAVAVGGCLEVLAAYEVDERSRQQNDQ